MGKIAALCWVFHENFTLQLLDLCKCSNVDNIDILQHVSINFLQFLRSLNHVIVIFFFMVIFTFCMLAATLNPQTGLNCL